MNASKNDQVEVDEEIWRAWIHKGKLRDQASARRGRILVTIALVILRCWIDVLLPCRPKHNCLTCLRADRAVWNIDEQKISETT